MNDMPVFADTEAVLAAARIGRLIDVRTPAEFAALRIPGAVNIPLDQLGLHAPILAALAGDLVLTCHSGKRALQAEALLAACGRTTGTLLVPGGTEGWRKDGGQVARSRGAISLERQIRIVAGAIVAIGSLLALAVSPDFVWILLVIGSGLVFAGVTDTCLMGMALARLPWNRRADGTQGIACVGGVTTP